MSDYAGLLEALKKRDEDANQSMIQKVHKAGGGKEEVQMNLKKINKGIKDSKDKRPTAKRKKVYNSPYGYKKGGVTIKKKSAKFSGGGLNKETYSSKSAAEKAASKWANTKEEDLRAAGYEGGKRREFIYLDKDGNKQILIKNHTGMMNKAIQEAEGRQEGDRKYVDYNRMIHYSD
tara:strand:- start:460 stop:987 length:528 start_codon:yes stop_codon:yes gene_type:complete